MRKIALLALLVCCYGCRSSYSDQPLRSEEVDQIPIPRYGTDGLMYARGIGESASLRIASSIARNDARTQLALDAEADVIALVDDFQNQTGSAVNKNRASEVFTQVSETLADGNIKNTRIHKDKAVRMADGVYRAQVVMGMPIKNNIEEQLDEEINLSDDEALKQEYQAWKAKQGLLERIRENRDRKGKQ